MCGSGTSVYLVILAILTAYSCCFRCSATVEDFHHEQCAQSDVHNLYSHGDADLSTPVHVMILFQGAATNHRLRNKFQVCVTSLLKHSTANIQFYTVGDKASYVIATEIIQDAASEFRVNYRIEHIDSLEVSSKVYEEIAPLQGLFGGRKNAKFSDSLFYLSTVLHKINPLNLEKVIMLDADLKFMSDIQGLHNLFEEFSDTQIIGLGPEAQPVYRHLLQTYRSKNPLTPIGSSLSEQGLPGFNSGVVLLHLSKMAASNKYKHFLSQQGLSELTEKYHFSGGHLGDQDFFSLVGFEAPELFYTLPCTWNRQLCTWWRDHGGQTHNFDLYFDCDGSVNIYHGNCDTPIPEH